MMTNEKPGGHGERSVAVGTIDMAVWDAVAKIEERPLFQLLAERHGNGVAKPRRLRLRRRRLLLARPGPRRPGARDAQLPRARLLGRQDEDRRRAARRRPCSASRRCCACSAPGQRLAVDANGRFDLKTAVAYAKALSDYDLFWYEEAGDPLDFALQAELANHYPGPMATGENLFSMQDARNLIRYGGMRPDRDWLQFDCALSYGLVEYLRTLAMLKEHGWSPSRCVPHGGHQMSLAIAAGLRPRRQRVVPRPVPALRRLSRRRRGEGQHRLAARVARHRLRRQGRSLRRDARPLGLSVVTRGWR